MPMNTKESGPDQQLPSERVISSVAEHNGTDPLELPPLYDSIDPDALDASIDALENGRIQFRYAGQFVTVESDMTVSLNEDLD